MRLRECVCVLICVSFEACARVRSCACDVAACVHVDEDGDGRLSGFPCVRHRLSGVVVCVCMCAALLCRRTDLGVVVCMCAALLCRRTDLDVTAYSN